MATRNNTQQHTAHVFAAYANIANHNMFVVLNEIGQKIQLKFDPNIQQEGNLVSHKVLGILSNKGHARQQQAAIFRIQKAFPFLNSESDQAIARYLGLKNPPKSALTLVPENYQTILKSLLAVLNDVRNQYTHADQPRVVLDLKMKAFLEALYDIALFKIQRRFKDSPIEQSPLSLTHLKRFSGKKEHNKKFSFFTPVNNCNEDKYHFSEDGLVFFLCLFLNKREGHLFLANIPGFKDRRTLQCRIKVYVYICYALRLPNAKMTTDRKNLEETLGLDILGELSRCPQILYDCLHPDDKKKYQVSMSDDNDSEDDVTPMTRKGERFIPLMLNYLELTDGFKALASCVDLGDFYFASYTKDILLGATGEVDSTVRRLKKKVLRFTTLTRLTEEHKSQQWKELERDGITDDFNQPYIVKTTPHYHLVDNNIILGGRVDVNKSYSDDFKESTKRRGAYEPIASSKPEFILSQYELINLVFLHFLTRPSTLQQFRAPETLIKRLSSSDSGPSFIERLLYSYRSAWNSVVDGKPQEKAWFKLDNVEFVLKNRYFPTVVRDVNNLYSDEQIKKERSLSSLVNRSLDLHIKNTQDRQAYLDKVLAQQYERGSRPGEVGFKRLKAGDVASFIAQDLLFLQPYVSKENPSKANSLYFQELQVTLAYFARDGKNFFALCKKINLVGARNKHPFLEKVLGVDGRKHYSGIIHFYQEYLKQRILFLNDLKTRFSSSLKGLNEYTWLPQRLVGDDDCDLNEYRKTLREHHPINLPRGLFLEPILYILTQFKNRFPSAIQEKLAQAQRELAEHGQVKRAEDLSINTVYLIEQFVKYIMNDAHPQRYDKRRNYQVLDKVYDRRTSKKDLLTPLVKHYWNTTIASRGSDEKPNVIDVEKIKKWIGNTSSSDELSKKRKQRINEFYESEQSIRLFSFQDQMLFLAMTDLQDVSELSNLKLRNISTDSLNIEIKDYQVELNLSSLGNFNKKSIPLLVNTVKVKHIGKYRHLSKDRRLGGLLSYYPLDDMETLDWEDIKTQLESYEQVQLTVFEQLLSFEKHLLKSSSIVSQDTSATDNDDKSNSMHQSLLATHYFKKPVNELSELEKNRLSLMITLRNAFCHNQFPNRYDPKIASNPFLKAELDKFVITVNHSRDNQQNPTVADLIRDKFLELYAIKG